MLRRRHWQPTPVLLPGKSHGRRSLVGCSQWDPEESDTTEQLHFHFSLSCIGEGNGNPLQCSCLENPRDGGACWAAVSGVAQSRTWLKRLSSSSSRVFMNTRILCKWGEGTGNKICHPRVYLFGMRILLGWLFVRNRRLRKLFFYFLWLKEFSFYLKRFWILYWIIAG